MDATASRSPNRRYSKLHFILESAGIGMTSNADLSTALINIDKLPALPEIAQKLLVLDLDTSKGEAEMLKLIAQDPQISAKVIGLSNSSLFFSPGKITSVSDAAMRLGLLCVKSVAMGIAVMSTLDKASAGKIKSDALWAHRMAIASSMKVIAKQMPANRRPSDEEIFLAGLLHGIGFSALNYLDTRSSDALHDQLAAESEAALLEIELEMLGMHHGELGARLGAQWGLPEHILAVIRHHHTPEDPAAEVGQPLVTMINLAEKMLSVFGVFNHSEREISAEEWTSLGIDPAKGATIREEVAQASEQAKQLAAA